MSSRARRRVFVGLLGLVVIFAWLLAQAGAALIVEHEVAFPDAIVMLASHEWERLPVTAALANQYPHAIVLLTVPGHVTPHNCHRCAERPHLLEARGIRADRIVLLAGPVNTYQEATAVLGFAGQRGVTRVMIVTSPYHTRRAFATFAEVFEGSGVLVGVRPASAHSEAAPGRWWMTPYDRWYVRYEWSALGVYLWRYGIIPRS